MLDKIKEYKFKAVRFFTMFAEQFAKSDKKTFKDNLTPMFGSAETCGEFVGEPYSKYDERAPDKWNDLIKAIYNEGKVNIHVLKTKENATVLKTELIHAEQLRQKKGGQIVEVEGQVADKNYLMALCELVNENWVLIYCGERVQS